MLSGKHVKLFLFKFRDCSEDKQLKSSGSAPPNRLQSLRSRDSKELNLENELGNNRLMGSGSEYGAMEKQQVHNLSVAQIRFKR